MWNRVGIKVAIFSYCFLLLSQPLFALDEVDEVDFDTLPSNFVNKTFQLRICFNPFVSKVNKDRTYNENQYGSLLIDEINGDKWTASAYLSKRDVDLIKTVNGLIKRSSGMSCDGRTYEMKVIYLGKGDSFKGPGASGNHHWFKIISVSVTPVK